MQKGPKGRLDTLIACELNIILTPFLLQLQFHLVFVFGLWKTDAHAYQTHGVRAPAKGSVHQFPKLVPVQGGPRPFVGRLLEIGKFQFNKNLGKRRFRILTG